MTLVKSKSVELNVELAGKKRGKKSKVPGNLEKDVKLAVKRVLSNWGAYYFMPVQTGYGARTLDILACVPVKIDKSMVGKTIGCFVGIETKREDINVVTPAQAHTMETMRDAGATALLINSVHDLDVEEQIIWAIKHGCREDGPWIKL